MVWKRISIRRLSWALVMLLSVVMSFATASGLLVLHQNYRTAEGRFESEANETLRHAALTIHNQLAFYNRMLTLIAANPLLSDLLEFSDESEAADWTSLLRSMLPGAFGLALARPDGTLIGDAVEQHVGKECAFDLQSFANGQQINYPPVHHVIDGLEHFDLFAAVPNPAGESAGVLFVSFRVSVLQRLIDDLSLQDKRFVLLDAAGATLAANAALDPDIAISRFTVAVPETSWRLILETEHANTLSFYAPLVVTDLTALIVVALVIVAVVRQVMGMFSADIERVRAALEAIHYGVFSGFNSPSAIAETEHLFPEIEALAEQLQEKHHQLAHESITDALTGLYNRRYFDLMLAHDYEQSSRQEPSFLIVVDLNDFKLINDRLGHAAGDDVLVKVGRFLQQQVRSSDTVARIGGDEFAVLLHNMSKSVVNDWVQQLLARFDAETLTQRLTRGATWHTSLSIGLAPIDADIFATADAVFVAADRAMYRAKKSTTQSGSRCETQAAPGIPKIA